MVPIKNTKGGGGGRKDYENNMHPEKTEQSENISYSSAKNGFNEKQKHASP